MLTKQTILIVGTGASAKAMATRLSGGNFNVLLCDKDYTKAAALASELKQTGKCDDLEAMQCLFDGAWEADIIILALNFQDQKEMVQTIKDVVNQKIVITTLLPEPAAGTVHSPEECEGKILEDLLPNTKIVKLFTDAVSRDEQPGTEQKINNFIIAGDDDSTVETVSQMLELVGFNLIKTKDVA